MPKKQIVLHRVACRACGEMFYGFSLRQAKLQHKKHIDGKCNIIRFMEKIAKILGPKTTMADIMKILGIKPKRKVKDA